MCYAAGICMYSITWSIYFRWYYRYVGKFSSGSIRFLSVPCIFDIAVNKNHESTKPLFIMKINQINIYMNHLHSIMITNKIIQLSQEMKKLSTESSKDNKCELNIWSSFEIFLCSLSDLRCLFRKNGVNLKD